MVKLNYEVIQAVKVIIEVICQVKLLIDVVAPFAKSLQVLETLPVELDLLTELAKLSRELLDSCSEIWGKILLCELDPLRGEFQY